MRSASPALEKALSRLSERHLQALHRIAKDKEKGLRPFFTDARNMIALRKAVEKKA